MARRNRRLLILAAAVAALATTAVSVAGVTPPQKTVTVRALLSYTKSGDEYGGLRLTITREGRVWRSGDLGATVGQRPRPLVRDLDADGEPEVWFDTYSGGAHCCLVSRFFHYDTTRHAYRQSHHAWGNVGYRAKNLDGRDGVELLSSDDRFAYVFTSFAGSYFPLRIWHFAQGRRADVTRRFPGLVEHDAHELWRTYLSNQDVRADPRGVLAAWLADQCLLGRQRQGWAELEAAYRRGELGPTADLDGWPQGRAYLSALKAHLRKLGYAA